MNPYRAQNGGVYRTVEILPPRAWWVPAVLALVSLACLVLGMGMASTDFREPVVGRPCGSGGCICGFGAKNCLEPVGWHFALEPTTFAGFLVFAALAAFAVAWLRGAKPVVSVRADSRSRTLSIDIRGASHVTVPFAPKPVLVSRDDGYQLHAGSRAPIALGARLSRKGVAELRALLDHLDA